MVGVEQNRTGEHHTLILSNATGGSRGPWRSSISATRETLFMRSLHAFSSDTSVASSAVPTNEMTCINFFGAWNYNEINGQLYE